MSNVRINTHSGERTPAAITQTRARTTGHAQIYEMWGCKDADKASLSLFFPVLYSISRDREPKFYLIVDDAGVFG